MTESNTEASEREMYHERHGGYDDTTHAAIELSYAEDYDVVRRVLKYDIGDEMAWKYDGGMLFLWGDTLDEQWVREIVDSINDIEQEHARNGFYDAAETARSAARWVIDGEVET